jgi:hypothetical protein
MSAGFRSSNCVAVATLFAELTLFVFSWCAFAQAADSPEVHGVIATGVHFPEATSEKLAGAAFELLAGSTARHSASKAEWYETFHGCHLHFKFVAPRSIMLESPAEKLDVAEMIMTLPLSRARIWVRSGDEYTWFAKWPYTSARLYKPIQSLLKEGILDE